MKHAPAPESSSEAEIIALRIVTFIAQRDSLLQQLIVETGVTTSTLSERTNDPDFLAGIVDFLLSNEQLLLEFCRFAEVDPTRLHHIRHKLPGATIG